MEELMRFEVGCRLRYQVKAPIAFVFNVAVADSACQEITEEQLQTNPALAVEEVKLVAGSRHMRLHAPASEFTLDYRASGTRAPVRVPTAGLAEVSPAELPLDIVHYVYPSRYCPSDQLLNFAAREFAAVEPGYVRVEAICDWIYANVEYAFGASDTHTTANDTLLSRRGVCRDFAHLGIALCRALNIPARFVTGYVQGLQPPDFHACFEAYLGQRWFLFDPTKLTPLGSLARIGTGRDAADASFATIFGSAQMMEMSVFYHEEVQETESDGHTALSTC